MKNSFKYFNNFVEKLHDKSTLPSKSPLKMVPQTLESKVSTLANTASLEEKIKTGSYQNKVLNQLGVKEPTIQSHRAHNDSQKSSAYDETFKLRKELLDFKEKEKKYLGKIHDLEKENIRLLDLIRENEKEFNSKIARYHQEKQEVLRQYQEMKTNLDKSPKTPKQDSLFLANLVTELYNKIHEIEKNAVLIIKDKKIGKENFLPQEESMIKTNEMLLRKCKEMEFVIFHLHNENKHLKQHFSSYCDKPLLNSEYGQKNNDIQQSPLPSSLKILDLMKKTGSKA